MELTFGKEMKMKMKMKKYHNYLFDLDGTLINTIDLIIDCFRHSLDYAGGVKVPNKEIHSHIGLPLIEQFKIYLGHLSDVDYEEIIREHMDYQLNHWRNKIFVYRDVKEILDKLKNNKCRLAIVTSRRLETAKLYTQELGLFDYFEYFITPESTFSHKPNPEPAFYALRQLQANRLETLFIGDSPFDIECGHRAGIETALAKWGKNTQKNFKYKPTYKLNKPTDILEIK